MFSSLPFAIGTVQDAGLIFLSSMANTIADTMLEDGHSESEILSTTLALLCSGTALLGLVLIIMGKFKLADAVSFLPMPVVGGYLAYIGYFCVLAGTSLCISQPMMDLADWGLLMDKSNLTLALPGLVAGLVLTLTSRLATSSGTLPMVIVAIPAIFYAGIMACGISLEEARESGWVGERSPAVPMSDLVHIIDFSEVRWDLISEILPTWFGMVFVVSFASCLDVAAISIDMGQPLDTNGYVLHSLYHNNFPFLNYCSNCRLNNYKLQIGCFFLFQRAYNCWDLQFNVWYFIGFYGKLYFFSNHFHLPHWSPRQVHRGYDYTSLHVHCCLARKHFGGGTTILFGIDVDLHWL
jgi:hypothetical protein